MIALTLSPEPAQRDQVIADLWEAGTSGITEGEGWLRAFFDAPPDLTAFASYDPVVEEAEDRDWVAHSQAMWQPFAVGERFYLVPEWSEDPAPCGRVRLRIRPGLACGSGAHPATQLCLMALERTVIDGLSVLDTGTGTGILAEAARALTMSAVFGCDIEPASAAIARANSAAMPRPPFYFGGSLRSVRDRAVDVVVANLNASTLASVAGDLFRVARQRVIVSGFREDEKGKVERSFARAAAAHLDMEDWACLIY